MMEQQQIALDAVGADLVSTALLELLNDFPGLGTRTIAFSELNTSNGMCFFPVSGAAIVSDVTDITGYTEQTCAYPFVVLFRGAPPTGEKKLSIKEYLDSLGFWLERKPVKIGESIYTLTDYPELDDTREIQSIRRTIPAHLANAYDDGIEDWEVSLTLTYTNNFYNP